VAADRQRTEGNEHQENRAARDREADDPLNHETPPRRVSRCRAAMNPIEECPVQNADGSVADGA
jgi:hypothetical protein